MVSNKQIVDHYRAELYENCGRHRRTTGSRTHAIKLYMDEYKHFLKNNGVLLSESLKTKFVIRM